MDNRNTNAVKLAEMMASHRYWDDCHDMTGRCDKCVAFDAAIKALSVPAGLAAAEDAQGFLRRHVLRIPDRSRLRVRDGRHRRRCAMTPITPRLSVEGPDFQGFYKIQVGKDWTTISPAEAAALLQALQPALSFGVEPLQDVRSLAGGFPADEDVDAFIQATRSGQDAPAELFVKCPTCGGSGYVFDGDDTEDNCQTCGTEGYVPAVATTAPAPPPRR